MSIDHRFLKLEALQTASPDRIFRDLEAFQADMIEAIVVGDPQRLHVRPSPWHFGGDGTAPVAIHPEGVVGGIDAPASVFVASDIDELLALRRLAKTDPADDHETLPPKLPDHPGFDASLADWTAWYYEVHEKDPSLKFKDLKDYSFDELKEVAKFKLIKQGTKYATDLFKDVLKEWLTDALSVTPNIPDVLKQLAADGDIAGDWLDEVKKAWQELENSFGKSLETIGEYLSDPSRLLDLGVEQFFKNGLPALADLGLKEFFGSIWGVDENSPAFERVMHSYVKYVVKGIVDDLLKDISSFADLKKNWNALGSDLKAKIKKFFTGESYDAKLPAARLLDKDSAVDRVFSGLPTVKAGGLDLARATDIIFPSSMAIVDGSGTVLAGSLPVARVSSMTMLGTVIEEGAAQVFVGGPPAAVTSDGAFYSPSGAAAAAAAKGAAAAAAEKAAAEKAAAEKAVPKVDELVKSPRVVSDMPPQVAFSAQMDQRMNEMSGMEKRDPKSGELHEFGAVIGIDADGNLHMGATQDMGPNGVNGLDRTKIPVGTTFAGDFHSHPGGIPTAFSGVDGSDFNAGVRNDGQSLSIVQSGNSRFMVITGTDTQVPDVFSLPAPEHSIMNRPVNNQADADARLDANTDYWNDSNVGFYGGNASQPLLQISPSAEGEKRPSEPD